MSSEVDFAVRTEPGPDGDTVVVLAGELDLYRVPALTEGTPGAADAHRVVVDLREVTFIDSTSLALLVQEHRRLRAAGHELVVLVGAQTPLTAFAVTGVDRLLTIQQAHVDRHGRDS